MVKFSVITINYNNRNGLEKTVKSVISQKYESYEYIVVDGGSGDGSLELIKHYAEKIAKWVSEKDRGIYDAQNKGIAWSEGQYLIFLNSGDCFHDENVLTRVAGFIENTGKKLVYGNTDLLNEDASVTHLIPTDKPDMNFWYANTLNHQAVFAHRELFDKTGIFDLHYKYAADFDFLFKCFVNNAEEFAHINEVVCDYDNSGLTSNPAVYATIIKERKEIIKSCVPASQYKQMRSAYLKSLSFKKRYSIISGENIFLKYTLKPAYGFYKFFRNRLRK